MMKVLSKLIVPILPIGKFKKMNDSLLFRIVSFSLGLLLFVCPVALNAVEIDLSLKESDSSEIVQAPSQMTEMQMNDLLVKIPI